MQKNPNEFINKLMTKTSAVSFDFFKENDALGELGNVTELVIPSNVKTIGFGAFECTFKLKHIAIPNSVDEIDDMAFWDSGLVAIELPNTIKRIGRASFEMCGELEEITIPDSVEKIGFSCFAECLRLEKVVIGRNVSEIEDEAFQACPHLKEVIFKGKTLDEIKQMKNYPWKLDWNEKNPEDFIKVDESTNESLIVDDNKSDDFLVFNLVGRYLKEPTKIKISKNEIVKIESGKNSWELDNRNPEKPEKKKTVSIYLNTDRSGAGAIKLYDDPEIKSVISVYFDELEKVDKELADKVNDSFEIKQIETSESKLSETNEKKFVVHMLPNKINTPIKTIELSMDEVDRIVTGRDKMWNDDKIPELPWEKKYYPDGETVIPRWRADLYLLTDRTADGAIKVIYPPVKSVVRVYVDELEKVAPELADEANKQIDEFLNKEMEQFFKKKSDKTLTLHMLPYKSLFSKSSFDEPKEIEISTDEINSIDVTEKHYSDSEDNLQKTIAIIYLNTDRTEDGAHKAYASDGSFIRVYLDELEKQDKGLAYKALKNKEF